MKKINILFALSLWAVAATASPVRFSLQMGYDMRDIRQHFTYGGAVHAKTLYGAHVGPALDFSIDKVEGLGIKTGIFYQITAKRLGDDLLLSTNEHEGIENPAGNGQSFLDQVEDLNAHLVSQVVQIPVRVSYTYEVNKYWDVFVFAGPQVEVGIQQSDMGTYTKDGQKYRFGGNEYKYDRWVRPADGTKDDRQDREQFYDYQYRQKFADLDFGFGVGFRYSHLISDFGFDWNLLNRTHKQHSPKTNKIHVGVIHFSVGYVF